ncbi:MAG: radical SAM protein [Candidatus Aminicenantes bacterium]|nr:radical SAM protein [Candidatus Aminicenantes bacterium]
MVEKWLEGLESCQLCEHRCRVNRLQGEKGVCCLTLPVVASACLHPAPPRSYTVFTAGCNFKCVNCQNWTISQYPDNSQSVRGSIDPQELASECLEQLHSFVGRLMGADRLFFSGGEPTIHLPYIEEVVASARRAEPDTKVNFDTNGYLTEESMERVLRFTTSITFDLKAFHNEVHRAITGADAQPVLRNARHIGRYARDKLWEFRIPVIPRINEGEIEPLCHFIADVDPSLPVCFLAFRPNFLLEEHPGATFELMERCVAAGRKAGLRSVYWSGQANLPGKKRGIEAAVKGHYQSPGAQLAASYALRGGCATHPRNCQQCASHNQCQVKSYIPGRST